MAVHDHMSKTAEEIDAMICDLARARRGATPAHPATFSLGQNFPMELEPALILEGYGVDGGHVLHIRHPAFGWLHFGYPRDEFARLARAMVAQAALPLPTRQ
jgi:hypothetical protein